MEEEESGRFEHLVAQFLDRKRVLGWSPRTLESYRYHLSNFLNYLDSETDIADVTTVTHRPELPPQGPELPLIHPQTTVPKSTPRSLPDGGSLFKCYALFGDHRSARTTIQAAAPPGYGRWVEIDGISYAP